MKATNRSCAANLLVVSMALVLCGAIGMFTRFSHATLLNPGESLSPAFYTLTFGTAGSGTDSIAGSGVENHGAFGGGINLRYFNGAGTQADGAYTIAYKNNLPSGVEYISDHISNKGPTPGSTYFGGGTFDGTALWLGHSRFTSPPAIGTDGSVSGTAWNGTTRTPDTGGDVRPDASHFVLVPVTTGQLSHLSFVLSQDIYVPGHAADRDGPNALSNGVIVSPYLDREAFGLTVPGGHGGVAIAPTLDTWHLLQIRADFTTDGGTLSSSSDDTGSVTYSFYLDNGASPFALQTFSLNGTQMQLRNGPLEWGIGDGLSRGWQGSAAEAFVDNITIQQIPEPASIGLLILGAIACGSRRR